MDPFLEALLEGIFYGCLIYAAYRYGYREAERNTVANVVEQMAKDPNAFRQMIDGLEEAKRKDAAVAAGQSIATVAAQKAVTVEQHGDFYYVFEAGEHGSFLGQGASIQEAVEAASKKLGGTPLSVTTK